MRIGILSDIHDNLWNLAPAVEHLAACDVLICCGDLCSPFVMDELRKFRGPVHIVFGNNDADLFRITRKSDTRLQLHGEFAELELGGRRIAVTHFDFLARPITHSGLYDVVCYGHNHRIRAVRVANTLAVNPGPIMGAAFGPSGWEVVDATFAEYETDGRLAFYKVSGQRVEPRDMAVESVWS
jgi:putative phosphoesterase